MPNTLHSNSVIIDTGFWVAVGNERDKYHEHAMQCLMNNAKVMITTGAVITETCYLLRRDAGLESQQAFLLALENGTARIFDLTQAHLARVRGLMHKYADLPMDYADASLVVLAEELGHGDIFSTDQRDFNTYRWKNHEPFRNLLLTG